LAFWKLEHGFGFFLKLLLVRFWAVIIFLHNHIFSIKVAQFSVL